MPKNDNVKSIRLYESVKKSISIEAAESMTESIKTGGSRCVMEILRK